jgi:flagellar biogenesis protein FliO
VVAQQAPSSTSVSSTAGAAAQPAATRPVRSEIGQRLIRREGAAATAQTQPASAAATTRPAVPAPPAVDLPKLAGALGIVLALIFALRAVFKHIFPASTAAGATRAVQVLSRSILSPKQQLVLVRVGRRLIVVADSGGQMSALSEITDADEVAALLGQIKDEKLSAAAPTFGGLLGRVRRGMEADDDAAERGATGEATNPDAIGADIRHPGEGDDAEVSSTRRELDGLLAKVRLISQQYNGRPG